MCALDILAVSGMLNYFGRAPESDNITITPVLLQKGFTKLALYGLSNVRDERLNRTFRDGKVRFMRPEVQQKEWFNLMCVHQNQYVPIPFCCYCLLMPQATPTRRLATSPKNIYLTSLTLSSGATSTSASSTRVRTPRWASM